MTFSLQQGRVVMASQITLTQSPNTHPLSPYTSHLRLDMYFLISFIHRLILKNQICTIFEIIFCFYIIIILFYYVYLLIIFIYIIFRSLS